MRLSDSDLLNPSKRRTLRFYMTGLAPCPYLDGRYERKAFTSLAIPDADNVHNVLSQSGFRRSQTVAYRPACPNCNACRSVRVDAREFRFKKRWRRIMNTNDDLHVTPVPAQATREQYRLLMVYLNNRHPDGGMTDMTYRDYQSMVTESPVQSVLFEYRAGPDPDDKLIAVSICDVLRDGLSMVYSFYTDKAPQRSLGSYMILDNIKRTQSLALPHVYLGYWVKDSGKMDYKRQFEPLEVLVGDQWQPLKAVEAELD